ETGDAGLSPHHHGLGKRAAHAGVLPRCAGAGPGEEDGELRRSGCLPPVLRRRGRAAGHHPHLLRVGRCAPGPPRHRRGAPPGAGGGERRGAAEVEAPADGPRRARERAVRPGLLHQPVLSRSRRADPGDRQQGSRIRHRRAGRRAGPDAAASPAAHRPRVSRRGVHRRADAPGAGAVHHAGHGAAGDSPHQRHHRQPGARGRVLRGRAGAEDDQEDHQPRRARHAALLLGQLRRARGGAPQLMDAVRLAGPLQPRARRRGADAPRGLPGAGRRGAGGLGGSPALAGGAAVAGDGPHLLQQHLLPRAGRAAAGDRHRRPRLRRGRGGAGDGAEAAGVAGAQPRRDRRGAGAAGV
ncbi:MAG: Glyoxalase family protein, partial [uncultured Gemmatimonadetes bacterium]